MLALLASLAQAQGVVVGTQLVGHAPALHAYGEQLAPTAPAWQVPPPQRPALTGESPLQVAAEQTALRCVS